MAKQKDISPWQLLMTNAGLLQTVLAEAEPEFMRLGMADAKAFFVLSVIEDVPNPAALATALMMPRPTVTFLVKRAVAAGHVERSNDENDLRKVNLRLTTSGRKAMKQGRRELDRCFLNRLSRLTANEQELYGKIIAKMTMRA